MKGIWPVKSPTPMILRSLFLGTWSKLTYSNSGKIVQRLKVKWLKPSIALHGYPSQSYGAIWDHTVLSATRHKWTHPAITPANQAGTWFTYPRGLEGWVDIVDSGPTRNRTHDRLIASPTPKPLCHQATQICHLCIVSRYYESNLIFCSEWFIVILCREEVQSDQEFDRRQLSQDLL